MKKTKWVKRDFTNVTTITFTNTAGTGFNYDIQKVLADHILTNNGEIFYRHMSSYDIRRTFTKMRLTKFKIKDFK